MKYKVRQVLVQTNSDMDRLDDLLKDGWEPFTVTQIEHGIFTYHLRKIR